MNLEPHHDLAEVLMSDLAASRSLEVEILLAHDEDALVAIEIVPEPELDKPQREPINETTRVPRNFSAEDFVTTIKLPSEAKSEIERTAPFARPSTPYERLDIDDVPDAVGVVNVAAITAVSHTALPRATSHVPIGQATTVGQATTIGKRSAGATAVGQTTMQFTRRPSTNDFASSFGATNATWFAASDEVIAKTEDVVAAPTASPYLLVILCCVLAVSLGFAIALIIF